MYKMETLLQHFIFHWKLVLFANCKIYKAENENSFLLYSFRYSHFMEYLDMMCIQAEMNNL